MGRVKETTAPIMGTEEKKGTGKTPRSWAGSFISIFRRNGPKASPKPHGKRTVPTVPINERGKKVEATPEIRGQQKTQELIPEPTGQQQTLDTEPEVSNVENKEASGRKRPYDSASNAQSTHDGAVSRVDDSGRQEMESPCTDLVDEMAEHRITAKTSRTHSHERRTSNAPTLFVIDDDLSVEAQLPVALLKEKSTGSESNTGCLSFGKTSSGNRPEKVPKGKIIYSKAGGNEEDTITFEVSLNDSVMKEVLNSIQEGHLPVGLATCGRRGQPKENPGKRASNKGTDDISDEFSVDIELCDPPEEDGEECKGGQTGGGSRHYSFLPDLVELLVRKHIEENEGDKEDCKSRYRPSERGGGHREKVTEPILEQTQVTAISDSALDSYRRHGIEVIEEEFGKSRRRNKEGFNILNGSASAGRRSKRSFARSSSNVGLSRGQNYNQQFASFSDKVRSSESKRSEFYSRYKDSVQTANQYKGLAAGEILGRDRKGRKMRRRYPSSNSSMECRRSNARKRYPSSNSSSVYRRSNARSKGKRSYQLHDRDVMRAHMKRAQLRKQRRQKAEVKHPIFCSCMGPSQKQNTTCHENDSLSARSGKHSEVDISTVSDGDSRTWKLRQINDSEFRAREGDDTGSYSGEKNEKTGNPVSDDETQTWKTSNSENSNVMESSPRRAKRRGWNLDRGADEYKTRGVENERVTIGIRKHQNTHRNIDLSDDSTILSFRESKASTVDNADAFIGNVYISELQDSLETESGGVEYEKPWDDDYSPIYLPGKHVNAPPMKTCRCHLTKNLEYSESVPDQSANAGGCEDGGLSSELVYQDKNDEDYSIQEPEEKDTDEGVPTDQGPENKWLERLGNVSVAQESDDYDTKDRTGSIQHETNGFLPQAPGNDYLSSSNEEEWSEKPPIISKGKHSHTQGVQTGEITSYQPTKVERMEEHAEFFPRRVVTQSEAPKWHSSLPQAEVHAEDENFISDEHTDHGIQIRTTSSVPQHTADGESVAQALKASQSLLQSVPMARGCIHVKSKFGTEEHHLSSLSKVKKLREEPFSVEGVACGTTSVYPESCSTSMSAPKTVITASHPTQDSHREDDTAIHGGHSRKQVSKCPHAGSRRKARCILAGAIKSDPKEKDQQKVNKEPCRHEFIEKECENEFIYSGELKRRRMDSSSFDPDEGHIKPSQSSSQLSHEIQSYDPDDLKQREASWKQYQKRYEAMIKRIEKMSEQAQSGLVLCPDITLDSNQLEDQNHKGLSASNVADESRSQSDVQILPSGSRDLPQPETKLLGGKRKPSERSLSYRAGRSNMFPKNTVKSIFKRSESEDSSSDDDIYDQASRKFRDALFKRVPRKDEESLIISSQIVPVSCEDCVVEQTRNKLNDVQRHLKTLTSSDPFRFSSVYKELLRVEQEMKETARTSASYARQEQTSYPDAHERSSNSRDGQKKSNFTGSKSRKTLIDGQDGGSKPVSESPPEPERDFSISLHKNPLWSKWKIPKTNSCGNPLSVSMAARLVDAEVPVDFENGYKVQYIPVDKRGNMGMRDKPPGREEPFKLFRLEEVEPLRKSRPYGNDSSSSSSENPGASPSMQIQDFPRDINYESSSSDSDSQFLHRRHQREVSKEVRCIRRKKLDGEDSDNTNNISWSDDGRTNLDLFVGEAEEQLARLKLAKVQLGRISPESLARVTTFYKKPLSQNNDKTRSDPWIVEKYGAESESSVHRQGKRVMLQKKRRSTVATTKSMNKLTAREIKEFHLLERRVQRELGATVRNEKPAKCQEQEGISEPSHEADNNTINDQIAGRDQHRCIDANYPSKAVLKAFAENDAKCGESSPIEEVTAPMSSVVKLFFGAQIEAPRTDEGRTANHLQGIYHMIRRKVELLEAEILHFTKGNREVKTLLKEQDKHAARLKQEKAAWEQQKASDMEAFQKYKEIQTDKLQKERTKLEQQARNTISSLPRKVERRAVDELKATLVQKQEAHSQKEEQWRLTGNRLRKDNKELSQQIHELRKEIRRLEQQILLQLDAQESPCHTRAKSFREMTKGRKERENIQSRLADRVTIARPNLKTPTANGDNLMISDVIKPSKRANYQIANTCDDANTMLAQKMKYLEKDVESWTCFHPDDYESEPVRY